MEENYDDSFYDNSKYRYKAKNTGEVKKNGKTFGNNQNEQNNEV